MLLLLLAPNVAAARWEGLKDNKAMPELQAMTDEELFSEAFDVCVYRALQQGPLDSRGEPTKPAPPAATEYLETIASVARNRNHGKGLRGMQELLEAHTAKKCQRAFRAFVGTDKAQTRRSRAAVMPRQHPRSQLPPWLAPHE